MNVILTWVLGVVLVFSLLAVFLWSARNKWRQPVKSHVPIPAFPKEEFAEEITFPVPPVETKPNIKPHTPDIPWNYGIDRLVLMVRDPNWIYAYWEITATKHEEFVNQYGNEAWHSTRPMLRVYDVTGVDFFSGQNANDFMDIPINDIADSWHMDVNRPNSSFCVDLGRMFPDGRFVTLLRSNIVHTPSVSVSNLLDEEWMWIEGIYRTITKLRVGSSPMIKDNNWEGMGFFPLGISSSGMRSETDSLEKQ